MNKRTLIISICLPFLFGCDISVEETYTEKTGKEKIKKCITVYEDSTDIPLQNAEMTFNEINNGSYLRHYAITNSLGAACFELHEFAFISDLIVEKDGFVSLCYTSTGPIIYLPSASYIKFHIKSREHSLHDRFILNYYPSKCSESPSIELYGTKIEYTQVVATKPGYQTITWTMDYYNYFSKELETTARDTTFVEIFF